MATGVDPKSSLPTAAIDRALHALGFEYTLISRERLTGRLKITLTCCQPFKVLNGGVSALMAEAMASLGAYVASGFRRVAGVQLSTNHLKAALLGEEVEAEAKPIQMGRTIQVWEVNIHKAGPSTSEHKELLSTSRVTLLCNRQAPEALKDYEEIIKNSPPLQQCCERLPELLDQDEDEDEDEDDR